MGWVHFVIINNNCLNINYGRFDGFTQMIIIYVRINPFEAETQSDDDDDAINDVLVIH